MLIILKIQFLSLRDRLVHYSKVNETAGKSTRKTLFYFEHICFPFASVLLDDFDLCRRYILRSKMSCRFTLQNLGIGATYFSMEEKYFWLNVFYFLIICGTFLQAIITADLQFAATLLLFHSIGWPCGLVVLPIYWTIVLKIISDTAPSEDGNVIRQCILYLPSSSIKCWGSNYFLRSEKPPIVPF